jgi:outer membrane protein TolC
MAARAQVREARSNYFPTVTVAPSYSRARTPGTLNSAVVSTNTGVGTGVAGSGTSTGVSSTRSAATFTDLSLPFDVSWEPDLWGRIRNTVHEFQYAAQVSAADLENERLTEQANLAVYYFELRGQDALQDLYNRTIEADRKALELTRVLVETGIDSPEAVAQAEVTLQNAEAAAVGIAVNRALYRNPDR